MFLTKPALLLRLEGLLTLLAAAILYGQMGGNWTHFALLFFTPDLSLAPYLIGKRIGAACHNTAHSFLLPLLLAAVALVLKETSWMPLLLIWFAHLGFDRALGFGLKFPDAFKPTHIQSAAVFQPQA